MLKLLEIKDDFELQMMDKAEKIIKSKLRSVPLGKIIQVLRISNKEILILTFTIQDRDFIDSVFFRFAMKQLPLRAGPILQFCC